MVHTVWGAKQDFTFLERTCDQRQLVPIPPLFELIPGSGTSWEEMYQVFNMGHRMELYVDPAIAEDIIAISESFGVAAQIVGRVEESAAKELTITSEFGTFKYSK